MRITEHYDVVVRQTIKRVTVGEEQVDYEVLIQMMDDPGAPYPALIPMLVIVLTMAGLHQDDRFGGWVIMPSITPTLEEVDVMVQEKLSAMREHKIYKARQIEHDGMGTR
jgi:hypothetical protein